MKKILITILSFVFIYTINAQTLVTAPLNRNNPSDSSYGTHIDTLGKGGLMAFSSTVNRDALPFALRKKGMIAVVADSMIYQLIGGLGNPNWVRRFFINGSSSGGGLLDSLSLNGNILCEYFTSGAIKCFTLPGGNCVSHVENGSVIWDSLLVFHSTLMDYFIGCRNFTAQPTDFTLDPAYVTAPRIDVWVVDTFGIIRVVKGDSSGLKYQYDPTWELEVAFATIGANATVPSNITNVGVYLENIEWVGTSDIPGALFNYATNPYAGLLSTYVPSFTNGQFVQYTDNITYDISGISFLNYRLRLDAALSSGNINITFYNGLIAITNPVTILDGQYGFNSATVGSYQLNAIPSSAWTLNGNGTDFDAVKFTFSGTGGPLQLDNVILQIGGSGTGGGNVVTSFTGGDGSPPRIGNVILRRTDVVWNYDSTALNYDSTYYKHYNNGSFLDSTWIVKTPIVARNGITITDTTINGIAAKIFIGSGSGSGLDSSAYISITGIAYGADSALIFCRRNGYCDTIVYTIGSTDWHVTGNAGTDTLINFLGTTDLQPLIFRVNNIRAGFISDSLARNTGFGWGALRNSPLSHAGITDTSEGNSAFGYKVLEANTKGSYNTGFGLEVLNSNTLGSQNSGVGYQALFKNISGIGNIANGYQSLYENLSGYGNVGIGASALRANTTGFENTAVGHAAMQSNTTSQWNVAYGYLTLANNTTGNYNTALGAEALRLNATGSASTAVGLWALYSNTSGNNTAVGTQSQYFTTTGTLNTTVGYHSIERNTTGSRNVAFGHNAGYYINDSSTFATLLNDGIYIGYDTKTLAATETNAIVIGAYGRNLMGDNSITLGNPQHLNTRFFGAIRDSSYGTGAITGTGTYAIQVDATGRFIEAAITGGGSGSGISEVVGTNGLSNVNDSTVQIGGTLIEDNTIIDLNGKTLQLNQDGRNFLYINAQTDNEQIVLRTFNNTGDGNIGGVNLSSATDKGSAEIYASFNDGIIDDTHILLERTATGRTITYVSDVHTFPFGSYNTVSIDPANDTIALRLVHSNGNESLLKIGDNNTTPTVYLRADDVDGGDLAEFRVGGGVVMNGQSTSTTIRFQDALSVSSLARSLLNISSGTQSNIQQGYETGDHPTLILTTSGVSQTSEVSIKDTAINITTPLLRINGVVYSGGGSGDALTSNPLSQFAATTSAQLASVISDEEGTDKLVFNTSPTLITPILGVATATSINKVAITAPATSATLTIADGKTLTVSRSLTLTGTDATTMTFPTTSATIARTDAAQTFTGTQTFGSIVATTGVTQGTSTTNYWNAFLSSLGATVATAEYKIGAPSSQFRIGFRGNTSTVATGGNNIFNVLIGAADFTEATTSTSPLAAGLGVVTPTMTNGAGATTDFQTIYAGDAPTGATNNWSINAGAINHRTKSTWDNTTTTVGTTGNQTINKSSGTVNIAAAGTTVTVTNSLVSATSLVFAIIRTADATARISNVVPAAGSFVVNIVACTAEVSIGFWVIN